MGMSTRNGWLLYDEQDFAVNRDFAELVHREGERLGLCIRPVLTYELPLRAGRDEGFLVLANGREVSRPEFVISRQRNPNISDQLEAVGIPVFNNAKVCRLCNDKRRTITFLEGFPMMPGKFVLPTDPLYPPAGTAYPVILKPAGGHGGDRVLWADNDAQWQAAAQRIAPDPIVQQEVADNIGKDLRVYIVFGKIVGAVMRTAKQGFISNFKKGGQAAWHVLTAQEHDLAMRVVHRFSQENAELCLAGVDFLYHQGNPVIGEVEDVVGSRMLYHVSDVNIVRLFLEALPV